MIPNGHESRATNAMQTAVCIAFEMALGLAAGCQAPPEDRPPAQGEVRDQKPRRPMKEANNLDLHTATAFHHRLSSLCVHPEVRIIYQGLLAKPRTWGGTHVDERDTNMLCWAVIVGGHLDDPGHIVCKLRASPLRDKDSVAECTVNGIRVFLSVIDIAGDGTLDTRPFNMLNEPNLKSMTIRDLIRRIGD